jgi:hypothetical protein
VVQQIIDFKDREFNAIQMPKMLILIVIQKEMQKVQQAFSGVVSIALL